MRWVYGSLVPVLQIREFSVASFMTAGAGGRAAGAARTISGGGAAPRAGLSGPAAPGLLHLLRARARERGRRGRGAAGRQAAGLQAQGAARQKGPNIEKNTGQAARLQMLASVSQHNKYINKQLFCRDADFLRRDAVPMLHLCCRCRRPLMHLARRLLTCASC